MFSKKSRLFGSKELITIENQKYNFGIEIIPTAGAHVRSLILKGVKVIDGVETEEELLQNPAFKSTFLAPFPNRIKDGIYNFEGKSYQLDINEKPRNNALHGLVYEAAFTLVEEKLEESSAFVTLKNEYKGKKSGYPFAFTTEVTLKIDIDKGFSCTMKFQNQSGRKIPFGFGWHPYFMLAEDVDNLKLKTPALKRFSVDQQMIPTGPPSDFHDFVEPQSLKNVQLDDCFEISKTGNVVETIVENSSGLSLKLWQETGAKKLNYLQIYTPPRRKSIAIEPQTSCVDAFNNNFGLFTLERDEIAESKFGVTLFDSK